MGKTRIKKSAFLIAVAVIFSAVLSSVSFGAPSHAIKYTPHNLSMTNIMGAVVASNKDTAAPATWTGGGQFASINETEVCIFCHTPHNAAAGKKFLWNRNDTAGITFQMYTSSPTLDFTTNPSQPSEVSKMCLTCHDGAGAVNAMANPRNVQMQFGDNSADQLGDIYWQDNFVACAAGGYCVNIGEAELANPGSAGDNSLSSGGGVLVNDHPISFKYQQSQLADGTLRLEDGGSGGESVGGLPLWWSDNGNPGYKVECVTCHDPHINYNPLRGNPLGDIAYMPFLRKTNNSSSLCFTCHLK